MFFHNYKYRCKIFLHNRSAIFWTLIFPIMMGTFFYVTFGNMANRTEERKPVPVAVVFQSENKYFRELLEELSSRDTKVLAVSETGKSEAKRMLEDGEADGVYEIGDSIGLVVKTSGMSQTILKSVMDSYLQMESLILETAKKNPGGVTDMVRALGEGQQLNQETSLTKSNMNPVLQNFYALLSMSILYASFFGISNARYLQANLSEIAARRLTAPFAKMSILLGDFTAALTIHSLITMVVLAYLKYILHIDFGGKLPLMVLTVIIGSAMGVGMGFFVGSIGRISEFTKQGIMVCVTLFLCFFSGLYYPGIKTMVDRVIPVLNQFNPAVAIADAFYSLNFYDTYGRYVKDLGILVLFVVLFLTGGYFMTRRKTYASL